MAESELHEDFYMDDVLMGTETLNYAKQLQRELTGILRSAGMSLHKWCNNYSELYINSTDYQIVNEEETTTLGVLWKSNRDYFSFKLELEEKILVTKRHVLSTIARLFDPIGLLGPVITKAKILIQKL